MKAKGTFKIESWDEKSYQEGEDGRKLTYATAKQAFAGDLKGSGLGSSLMSYRPDGSAAITGLLYVEGQLGKRKGSFVARANSKFDGKKATGTWRILKSTGTGDFATVTGTGRFSAPSGPDATYELDLKLR